MYRPRLGYRRKDGVIPADGDASGSVDHVKRATASKKMGWVADGLDSIRSFQIRHVLTQIVSLGLTCVTGSQSPVVVVLSESMEPGFKRQHDTGEIQVLTKGDNNFDDDRLLYAHGQLWLEQHHIMGRAVGFLPYLGWVTIIMTEKPIVKLHGVPGGSGSTWPDPCGIKPILFLTTTKPEVLLRSSI
ncbi:hypothetical protein BHE74_00026374 [Ensete ventricosum]|nr:hypothetical protein BHE74_00026374 [Ensete ventricosum]RZR81967.1 hypothetical protein BHM03_00008290 [Ensete ventricosum]